MTSMTTEPLQVRRRPDRFVSDDRRVITRFLDLGSPNRIRSVLSRLTQLSDDDAADLLDSVMYDFSTRHRDIGSALRNSFREVAGYLEDPNALSQTRQMLIGAFFTMEYSIESAALFNPSIVVHPNQRGLADGELRFLMSLRATGEGHVSSIVFRRGVIDRHGHIRIDPPPRYAVTARPIPDKRYEKKLFLRKLSEMSTDIELAGQVAQRLGDFFTMDELCDAIFAYGRSVDTIPPNFESVATQMHWLARANYELRFPDDAVPDEMVIFPATANESHGMEDLRLVRFIHEDGTSTYYGTYTAYDGRQIIPMILQTDDFHSFHVHTLNGRFATNKGMAMFPRTVGGAYLMVARHDGESLYVLESDNPHFWNESKLLQPPAEPWEMVQIGNSGSPIETEAGWVLLTHGVGPMRRYCIGAMLLDRDDPYRVIGRLRQPLIVPTDDEREGYVPNVVYSCGAMLHGEQLIIPYAMADRATTIASVSINDLLQRLVDAGP
jgi:predicted GH43/DUF377 family glycosyl hydrolase